MIGSKPTQLNSILALEFSPGRLQGVYLHQNGRGAQVQKSFSVPLALDPLTVEPELLGQELRNHLDEAGIRERNTVLCLPLRWILKSQMEVPVLTDEDKLNFIQLHAEREFPYDLDELSLSQSDLLTSGGGQITTVAAIPLRSIQALEKVCQKARLTVRGITFAYPELTEADAGAIYLLKREEGFHLFITVNKQLVYFRCLENVEESNTISEDTIESLFREIKITLRELPQTIHDQIRSLQILASDSIVRSLTERFQEPFESIGIDVRQGDYTPYTPLPPEERKWNPLVPVVAAAFRYLRNQKNEFEFLPPKVSKLQQLVSRLSSSRNLVLGGSAAAILLFCCGALLIQHIKLSNLQAEWNAIEAKVAEVEALQQKVKLFRPWFDDSAFSLQAIRTLTTSFPEEGTVWAKSLDIQDISTISCSGFAKDNRDLLMMFDRLNEHPEISELQILHTQGSNPIQFSFRYFWTRG